ncbi:mono-functional DNA-alkylating methyl methanesulfonate N-term-domain-containing protein [Geopyxis carbonaria]|nr:mono-functional DNA-alkylating methyl methanesulfonate N-term-domain-containing protein [Geopyxis carbonaria]
MRHKSDFEDLGSLVTAWARPFRAPVYSVSHDDMYLALENGQIYFLEVDSQAHMLVQTATNASKFDCAIGTAFACLDYGLGNDDMLVAGGEMSSGGIYLLKIAAYPKKESTSRMQESVTNWAPVFDFELVNLPAQGQSIGGATRDRVFAITGRGLHGAVTELRYGLQARIQGTADYVHGIKRLFILPDAAGRGYFVLSSLADCSEICFLSSVDGGNWNVCEGMSALDLSEPTLAAGPLEKHDDEKLSHALKDQWLRSWSVQITPTAIIAAHLHDEVEDPEDLSMENRYCDRKLQQRCKNGDTIVGAAIYRGFVLVAMRADESIQLILALIDVKRESDQFLVPIGNPWPMEDDPSFVSIVELRGYPFAIVGTRQATVRIYQIDKSTGLHSVYEQSMVESPEVVERDLCVCESAVVMETPDGAAKLLCGLRGGTVLVFDIITSANTLKTVKTREINFGPIPIQLQPDYCRRDSAFILAGPELYRFDMPKNSFRAAQIVFKDTEVDPVIQAITQIDNSPDPENIIVCATKDQIIYADVDRSENMCGRRLKLNETPRRVLFYRPLNVLIVACSRRADTTAGQKKTSLCTLKFIDPKT